MCGIITIIQKDTAKVLTVEHTAVFKQMLYADALRGWDSTGIAAVKGTDNVSVFKDTGAPAKFFYTFPENTWAFNNKALIGHNRWATRGATNKENAHPFQEKNITLVHNGTLKYHHHLKNVQVDSHAITHCIAEQGEIKTLEQLDGAYALVWYNQETGLINAARNNERPLYILETQDLFILASEYLMAEWICDRNGIKVKKVQLLTAGLVYSFKTNKKGMLYPSTQRFCIHTYTPPVHQTKDTQNVLPFPNNKVTAIAPYKGAAHELGVPKVGQTLDVLMFRKSEISHSAFGLGTIKWLAESVEYPEIMVEVYTSDPTNFEGLTVSITVHQTYYSPGLKQEMLIGRNPEVKKRTVADANGPITSSNGIELTDQVIDLCKNKFCEICTADFKAEPGITLEPFIVNGHTYTYKYTCATCTEYEALMGRMKS